MENSKYLDRIDHLRKTGAHVKFLSLEPLLGPLHKMNLCGIDWAIVGGESGPGARPIDPMWVTDIRDQCVKAGVAFFFKQWGGVQKKKTGRELDGRTWDQMPELTVIFLMERLVVLSLQERKVRRIHRQSRATERIEGFGVGQSFCDRQGRNAGRSDGEVPRVAANANPRNFPRKDLPELKMRKILGCWCAPEPCHGDILSELANR